MSNSVQPHRWQPTRLRHPWDSPGKNTGVGCHFLLQCMKVKSESEVSHSFPPLRNPWTTAHQAPLSMEFSRQEYWSGSSLPSLSTCYQKFNKCNTIINRNLKYRGSNVGLNCHLYDNLQKQSKEGFMKVSGLKQKICCMSIRQQ